MSGWNKRTSPKHPPAMWSTCPWAHAWCSLRDMVRDVFVKCSILEQLEPATYNDGSDTPPNRPRLGPTAVELEWLFGSVTNRSLIFFFTGSATALTARPRPGASAAEKNPFFFVPSQIACDFLVLAGIKTRGSTNFWNRLLCGSIQ